MVNCKDVVIDILKKYGVCTHREITDRIQSKYKFNNSRVNKSITYLYNIKKIDRKSLENPYNTQSSFYFIPTNINGAKREDIIEYKLDLMTKQSKFNDQIARFAENLVSGILDDLGYSEIETRKRQHKGIGLGKMELDVWGYHLFGYYQHIEVKNRKQPVGPNDIIHLECKTSLASSLKNPIQYLLVFPL